MKADYYCWEAGQGPETVRLYRERRAEGAAIQHAQNCNLKPGAVVMASAPSESPPAIIRVRIVLGEAPLDAKVEPA